MSGRDELPAMASNAIEQLLEQCQAAIRRLLIVGSVCLVLLGALGLALVALLTERAP